MLVGVVIAGYLRATRRASVRASLIASLLCSSVTSAVFWYLARGYAQNAWVFPLIYIWVGLFGVLAPAQVWTLANYSLTTREAKRVFGLVGSGGICGWIFGGFLSARAGHVKGLDTENLLLAMGVFLALSAVLVVLIWQAKEKADAGATEPAERLTPKAGPRLRDSLRLVGASRYLRTIAILVWASSFITTIAGWQFKAIAKQVLVEKNLLASFFGEFNFYAGIISLLLQLLLTSRLLRRFGIGPALLIVPLALMASSVGVLLWGTLAAVVMLKGSDQVLRYSVDKSSMELLYLPVDPAVKVQVKSFIDTVIWRLGDGLAGLAVLIFATYLHWSASGISRVNLVLIPGWIIAAVLARRYYVATLRESIRQHRLDAGQVFTPVLDRNTTYEIRKSSLAATTVDEAVYTLGLLGLETRPAGNSLLRERLGHPAPEVRRKAIAMLAATNDASAFPAIEPLLNDANVGVRAEALLCLSKSSDFDPLAKIEELASFPDLSLRVAVAQHLAQPGKTQKLEVVRFMLHAMAAEAGPEGKPARLAAARLLDSMPDQFDETLQILLADPDTEVMREAIKLVAKRRKRRFVPELLDRLSQRELAGAISDTLVHFGDAVVGTLGDYLADSSVPLETRRRIPRILSRIATPAAADVMARNLLDDDPKLRSRLIAGLQSIRQVRPELELGAEMLETALALEMLDQYRSCLMLAALGEELARQTAPSAAEASQATQRIFAVLGLLYPHSELYGAYFGLQSANPGVHDNALEFLDNILSPEVRRLLVPLVDAKMSAAERTQLARQLLGAELESREGLIKNLLASEHAWLRRHGVFAAGILRTDSLLALLEGLSNDPDPAVREAVRRAKAGGPLRATQSAAAGH